MAREFFAGLLIVLFSAGVVFAQEHFGITVYPGAKTDRSMEWACKAFKEQSDRQLKMLVKKPLKTEVFCYRTGDDYAKVIDFYKKQKAVVPFDIKEKGTQKVSIFCAPGMKCASIGEGLLVSATTPWADDKVQMKDTLIVIMKTTK
jgi:hypothetical protein